MSQPLPGNWEDLLAFDRAHVWHPYASAISPAAVLPVVSASGVRLRLADGREVIDGMSSWWAAIHGYAVPSLDEAVRSQLGSMAHVMFGGLTHEPAIRLASRLIEITAPALTRVFFADSGSVGIEVALKTALQFWQGVGQPARTRVLTVRGGYHGDTTGAMSVCDPDTGMHGLFTHLLPRQVFASRPRPTFDQPVVESDLDEVRELFEQFRGELAAVIIEPVVQGAGGMRFYAPGYLAALAELCREHDTLLIADEIATGFGRSGKLFGCDWADVTPDIAVVGKALTGGYLTMSAMLCTERVALGVSQTGALMHGPTFMANPLACAVALASIDLLLSSPWESRVAAISSGLSGGLAGAAALPGVVDIRVLGAIGVVELEAPVDLSLFTPRAVARGAWLRPFGKLVYTMPPFVCSAEDVATLTGALVDTLAELAD